MGNRTYILGARAALHLLVNCPVDIFACAPFAVSLSPNPPPVAFDCENDIWPPFTFNHEKVLVEGPGKGSRLHVCRNLLEQMTHRFSRDQANSELELDRCLR